MDLQAQDRAHRIGQKRPVIVYRLAAANTVESKMLAKTSVKRKLEKMVILKGRCIVLQNIRISLTVS
jgi:ATP-dependent DNA helicase